MAVARMCFAGFGCLRQHGRNDAEAAARARDPELGAPKLIAELAASNPYLQVADVELIVTTTFDQITVALARGECMEFCGLGALIMKQRNARIVNNPRARETIQVDENAVPRFKAGKELRGRLNHKPSRPASARAPGTRSFS